MLTTPHALVGLTIYKLYPHPISLFFSLVSHYLLDYALPHWNPHIFSEFKKDKKISKFSLGVILGDGVLAVFLTLIVMTQALPNFNMAFFLGLSSFLAVLPDAIEIPYYFLGMKNRFFTIYAKTFFNGLIFCVTCASFAHLAVKFLLTQSKPQGLFQEASMPWLKKKYPARIRRIFF